MRKLLYMLFFVFIIGVSSALAADYYVKNGGNDSADGLIGNAWATIAHVNDCAEAGASPPTGCPAYGFDDGDTINLERGSTWSNDETIGYNGSIIDWGTINGLTIQDYGAGALPRLNTNTQQAIMIAGSAISNLTIKNIDISGMDWTYGHNPNSAHIWIENVIGITIDGIYADGHVGSSVYPLHEAFIKVSETVPNSGNIEIKNCTLTNNYQDTFANSITSWGSLDADAIIFWFESSGVPKVAGTVSVHDNSTISNVYSDGIHIGGIQTTMNIYNNTFSGFGEQAIDTKKSRYINIYNNDISHNDFGLSPGGGDQTGTGIMLGSDAEDWPGYSNRDITVHDNYIHDDQYRGIAAGEGYNTKIYNNYFKDCGNGIWTNSPNVKVYNNLINLTGTAGRPAGPYKSAIYGGYISGVQDNLIYNNTIYISGASYLYGIYWEGASGQSGNDIKNNIIQMTSSSSVYPLYVHDLDSSDTFPTVSYNNYYNANHSNRVSWDGTVYDNTEQADWRTAGHTGALFSDPLFVNPATPNFSLQAGSPAIGVGLSTICDDDDYKDGISPSDSDYTDGFTTIDRKETGQCDMGAFVADTTAPTHSGAGPSGTLSCTSDERNVTMYWTTSETANSRIDTSDKGDYDDATADSVTNTNSTSHNDTESFACGGTYNRYVYSEDIAGNESTLLTITFTIESGEPPAPDPDEGSASISGGGCSGGGM